MPTISSFPGASRRSSVALLATMLVACRDAAPTEARAADAPAPRGPTGDRAGPEAPQAVVDRAAAIRSALNREREWSGAHSPVPRRAITLATLGQVRRQLDARDADALLLLAQDDAYDIRSAAATLLECVDPDAERRVAALIDRERDATRLARWIDVRTALRAIRAGGTSCA